MQDQSQDPYNFIMDPNLQQKNRPAMLQNPKQRIIISIVFVVVVLMVLFIAYSFIASLGKQDNSALISINAQQNEIIRISDLGLKEAKDPNTKTLVATLKSFVVSDQVDTESYLSKNGTKITPEQAVSKKDSSIDEDLETALQRNNYDEALLASLKDLQSSYKKSLSSALSDSSSTTRKQLLETAIANLNTYETQK